MSTFKLKLIKLQGQCLTCKRTFAGMEPKNIVVDHDHKTGLIRGALCRGCNGAEGKVANAVGRWAGTGMDYDKILVWLENMVTYLRGEPHPYIYPTHLSEEEKKKKAGDKRLIAAQARARKRAAAIAAKKAAK